MKPTFLRRIHKEERNILTLRKKNLLFIKRSQERRIKRKGVDEFLKGKKEWSLQPCPSGHITAVKDFAMLCPNCLRQLLLSAKRYTETMTGAHLHKYRKIPNP